MLILKTRIYPYIWLRYFKDCTPAFAL